MEIPAAFIGANSFEADSGFQSSTEILIDILYFTIKFNAKRLPCYRINQPRHKSGLKSQVAAPSDTYNITEDDHMPRGRGNKGRCKVEK